MSGSPALAGNPPTDPNGVANNHGGSGINTNQSGINTSTAGNLYGTAQNYFAYLTALNWIKTKGSKLEYGLAARFEVVLGLKNAVIGGFKTSLDLAWNRTYNLNSYTTLFGGARYEVIRPKKIETVYGKKDDDATLPKKERVGGVWTHTAAAKEQKAQATFKSIVDSLMEEAGANLEKTIAKYEADWKKVEEDAKSLNEKCSATLREKIVKMKMTITNYKQYIDKITDICKKFELKSAQMDIAADSAMNIETPKLITKGAMLSMNASTLKFMGDLVKLGE